jgi:solute:Na+ symporter, SSS family
MNLTLLDKGIFAAYMVIIVAVGIFSSRKVGGTRRDYFLAGDKLPWWMVGGSIVAANISSHHLIGVMGTAYAKGFVAMTVEWGAILLGFNALLWIFLPYYLRNGFYTMPEFLERRYGSAARSIFAALIMATYIFVEISAVLFLGAIAINSLLGINLWASIVGLALTTGLYTILGGLTAVVWTEMVQLGVLLMGGIALSIAAIRASGGISAVIADSHNWHLILPATDADFPWTMYIGGLTCISVFYCAANQFIVQRTLAAKNEWHARMGIVFTDYLKFLMPLIIIVPGLLAPKMFPNLEKPDMVFPTLVKTLLPTGLVGLVMAALIAAVMSHVSGAINSCTTIFTLDFYIPYMNKNATELQAVRAGKIAGVVIMILGIAWAEILLSHSEKPIFIYLFNAYGYVTPGIATMFLLGIFWRRTTYAGAMVAGALTIPLTILIEYLTPCLPQKIAVYFQPFLNRTGVVFWLCMLAAVVVSFLTKPVEEGKLAGLIWTRQSLRMPANVKPAIGLVASPFLWWALITAAVLYMYIRYW